MGVVMSLFRALTRSNRPYVKPELVENVHTHRYATTTATFFNIKVLNPLCDYLVDKLPMWLAPNLITLFAFSLHIVSIVLLLVYFGTDTAGPLPGWFPVFFGVAYSVNNTLDNMDGKQARRTKSGSPLGMLCDHGCDTASSIIIPIICTRIYQLGSGIPIMLIMVVATVPPYHLLMQEYYTGCLDMPALIDPDNTSLQVSVVCFLTAFFGADELWGFQIPLPYDYKLPLN